jgi:aldose 1-epimerase
MYQRGAAMELRIDEFGDAESGKPVHMYDLINDSGMEVQIINYGGIVTSIRVPDRRGETADVVLGFNNLPDYHPNSPYFGCIAGRFANRIAQGRFTLNGAAYALAQNNGPNHLHGGLIGFDKVVWSPEPFATDSGVGLALTYLSPDGEEGYPGNLLVRVTYTLKPDNALEISYRAETDRITILNLTNHSYFNLAGGGDILSHEIAIDANRFTPIDETLIPTGELRPVKDTPMDFRRAAPIGARIDDDDPQLLFAGGYDHNWVLNGAAGELRLAASVWEAETGRTLETYTTQPGVQFYTGNFLDGTLTGKDGIRYARRSGFCLETQHFPDSPNQPNFPSTTLEPGQQYQQTTVYKFATL